MSFEFGFGHSKYQSIGVFAIIMTLFSFWMRRAISHHTQFFSNSKLSFSFSFFSCSPPGFCCSSISTHLFPHRCFFRAGRSGISLRDDDFKSPFLLHLPFSLPSIPPYFPPFFPLPRPPFLLMPPTLPLLPSPSTPPWVLQLFLHSFFPRGGDTLFPTLFPILLLTALMTKISCGRHGNSGEDGHGGVKGEEGGLSFWGWEREGKRTRRHCEEEG